VYDAATQAWHERAGLTNGLFTRHRSNCQCNFQGNTVVGDFENGNIYQLNLTEYKDHDQPQKWLRSWRALPAGQNDLKRTAQHSLQLTCETGVGLNLYPAYDSEDITTESGDILVAEVTVDWPEPYPDGYALSTTAYLASPGYTPQVMLRWSDDGGHTWSNEHWTSMGRIGEYGTRAIWRRLGMTQKLRDRVYEVSGTDPVKIDIVGAELIISGTNA
jgi:hypothetical protein